MVSNCNIWIKYYKKLEKRHERVRKENEEHKLNKFNTRLVSEENESLLKENGILSALLNEEKVTTTKWMQASQNIEKE